MEFNNVIVLVVVVSLLLGGAAIAIGANPNVRDAGAAGRNR